MPSRNGRRKLHGAEDDEVQIRVPRGSAPPVTRKRASAVVSRSASVGNASMRASSPDGFESALSPLEQSVVEAARSPSPVSRVRSQHRSNTIRLGSFSGVGMSLSTHLAKLDNCAQYYGWNEMERVCHLKSSLEGAAGTVLWQVPSNISEAELVKLLEARFGDTSLVEVHRAALRARRRKRGESLQELHLDICRLVSLAYPRETSELSKILARDAFLESLGDGELRIKILESGAVTLDQAFATAVRFESYRMSGDVINADEGSRPRVRATNVPAESRLETRLDKIEAAVARFADTVQTLNSQLQASVRRHAPVQSVDGRQQPQAEFAGVEMGRQRQETNSGRHATSRRTCYTCGEAGHLMRNCPKRSEDNRTSAARQPQPKVRVTQTTDDGVGSGQRVPMEVCVPIKLQKGSTHKCFEAIIDSGSIVNIAPERLVNRNIRPTLVKLAAVNGSPIETSGEVMLNFEAFGMRFREKFVVSAHVDEIILGLPWLHATDCTFSCKNATAVICGKEVKLHRRAVSSATRRVLLAESVLIQPRECATIPVIVARLSRHSEEANFVIEPKFVNDRAIVARALLAAESDRAVVKVLNPSYEPVKLNRFHCLGVAEAIDFNCRRCGLVCACQPSVIAESNSGSADVVCGVSPERDSAGCSNDAGSTNTSDLVNVDTVNHSLLDDTVSEAFDGNSADDLKLIEPILESLPNFMSDEDRVRTKDLLLKYTCIFAKHEFDVGKADCSPQRIELIDSKLPPIREPLRTHPYAYLQKIDDYVNKLLEYDIVTPAPKSAWAANLILVPKRDQPNKYRVAIDLRKQNARIQKLSFPMQSMSQTLNSLHGKRLYSVLDLSQAYLAMPLDSQTSDVTSFVTRRGVFKYRRLPAGLGIAPALWNQYIMRLFADLQWSELCVFVDDITFGSSDVASGLKTLEKIFERLKQANLRVKVTKCKLFQKEVTILGVLVSEGQFKQDPSRVSVINALKFPKTIKELNRFSGHVILVASFVTDTLKSLIL